MNLLKIILNSSMNVSHHCDVTGHVFKIPYAFLSLPVLWLVLAYLSLGVSAWYPLISYCSRYFSCQIKPTSPQVRNVNAHLTCCCWLWCFMALGSSSFFLWSQLGFQPVTAHFGFWSWMVWIWLLCSPHGTPAWQPRSFTLGHPFLSNHCCPLDSFLLLQ